MDTITEFTRVELLSDGAVLSNSQCSASVLVKVGIGSQTQNIVAANEISKNTNIKATEYKYSVTIRHG